MPNKGKDITKLPRAAPELLKLEGKAREVQGDTLKTYLLLRYIGFHPRVIFPFDYSDEIKIKEYNLHKGLDDNKREIFIWDRPKKRGAKAYTTAPRHPSIDFDVEKFIREVRGRKSKYKRSTAYGNRLIRELGEDIGIFNLSPLSLRHTLAVELYKGGMPLPVICDTLNMSPTTARTYIRFAPEDRHNAYDKAMGLV
jgi:integrase